MSERVSEYGYVWVGEFVSYSVSHNLLVYVTKENEILVGSWLAKCT